MTWNYEISVGRENLLNSINKTKKPGIQERDRR